MVDLSWATGGFLGALPCWDSASLLRAVLPMPIGEEGLSAEAGKGTGSSQGTTAGEWPVWCPYVPQKACLSFLSALLDFSPKGSHSDHRHPGI